MITTDLPDTREAPFTAVAIVRERSAATVRRILPELEISVPEPAPAFQSSI